MQHDGRTTFNRIASATRKAKNIAGMPIRFFKNTDKNGLTRINHAKIKINTSKYNPWVYGNIYEGMGERVKDFGRGIKNRAEQLRGKFRFPFRRKSSN